MILTTPNQMENLFSNYQPPPQKKGGSPLGDLKGELHKLYQEGGGKWGIKLFCIKTSHLREPDLHYMISVAKDKKKRQENVSGYIAGHFSKGMIE